ncbi:hypothetical protein [Deinococcus irradiatisoli]|uniref:hypothetical protein n=1 Tax=Deinococcus irradiatisoli TaxID=2202254 RepID=UPI0011B1EA2D|nr:hypothetical protein [Deinococcus irradiatisoli]
MINNAQTYSSLGAAYPGASLTVLRKQVFRQPDFSEDGPAIRLKFVLNVSEAYSSHPLGTLGDTADQGGS